MLRAAKVRNPPNTNVAARISYSIGQSGSLSRWNRGRSYRDMQKLSDYADTDVITIDSLIFKGGVKWGNKLLKI